MPLVVIDLKQSDLIEGPAAETLQKNYEHGMNLVAE
jgi:hypothetical protein